tara:strand:+ start:1125 stop:1313 length:189 start_codon:yes stop_codon:yes gene_type:complete
MAKKIFSIGELIIFPGFKTKNNKYYYAIIVDIIESDRYLGKAYNCLMNGELIILTKSTIAKI